MLSSLRALLPSGAIARAPVFCAAILPVVFGASCSSSGTKSSPPPASDASVELLVDQLVEQAELRADLSSMRLVVDEMRGSVTEKAYGPKAKVLEAELSSLGAALQHELMIALAERVHLIDTELATERAGPIPADASLTERAKALGATHALVGTFVKRDDDLRVSVRLVDARSSLIVAVAGGTVSYDGMMERARLAWNPPPYPVEVGLADAPAEKQPVPVVASTTAPTEAPATELQRQAKYVPRDGEPAAPAPRKLERVEPTPAEPAATDADRPLWIIRRQEPPATTPPKDEAPVEGPAAARLRAAKKKKD